MNTGDAVEAGRPARSGRNPASVCGAMGLTVARRVGGPVQRGLEEACRVLPE